MKLTFMKKVLLLIVPIVLILTSCSSLHGNYIPLDKETKNPFYEPQFYASTNRLGDTIQQMYHLPDPRIRPFYDTITFVSGNRVKAMKRSSGIGSCCAPAIYKITEDYQIQGDTLKAQYGTYLIKGDTLFPLHSGLIYVKE